MNQQAIMLYTYACAIMQTCIRALILCVVMCKFIRVCNGALKCTHFMHIVDIIGHPTTYACCLIVVGI